MFNIVIAVLVILASPHWYDVPVLPKTAFSAMTFFGIGIWYSATHILRSESYGLSHTQYQRLQLHHTAHLCISYLCCDVASKLWLILHPGLTPFKDHLMLLGLCWVGIIIKLSLSVCSAGMVTANNPSIAKLEYTVLYSVFIALAAYLYFGVYA
jgi:hypothetical protein